jgi:D-alanyl-lipoteichoic acid acyltransferase DltB (MBOAT superfamily)
MSFTDLSFLFIFLPVVMILCFLIHNINAQNAILLIASLIFYAWGEPKAILVLVGVILANYGFGLWIQNDRTRKYRLWIAVIANLSVLFLYKYLKFVTVDILQMAKSPLSLALPLGISFYLFSAISYLSDVYHERTEAEHSLFNFALYMSLFPKLLVGPIARYPDIIKQINSRRHKSSITAAGLRRFTVGLGKKVLLANQLAVAADLIFGLSADQLTAPLAWLGALAFMLEIYYDFSGYSDMAIGLGSMLGFSFPENFNYPYLACSVQEFWHRWHITLSSWFRDYVYIPLGGNRVSKPRWILNILIVWSLTGLWHGAAWNYILWGLYYGVLLIIEKKLFKHSDRFNFFRWLLTMVMVLYGWVLFNASDLSQIIWYTKGMFTFQGSLSRVELMQLGILYLWPYFILAVLGCGPWLKRIGHSLQKKASTVWIVNVLSIALLVLCIVFLISNSYSAFIYFKF